MYARLAMEEEEGGGEVEGVTENVQQQPTFVLIGRFLTEKNINFQVMKNVLASIWRPREGMDFYDLGGLRYSFIFYHALDLQKVIEGGPWTFEQSLLLYHKLEANEDAHTIQLNKMEIWVQVYDLPVGMISEKLLEGIGNYVGTFVKSDPQNIQGGWRVFYRIRVVMDVNMPIKRRMKLKREGGEKRGFDEKFGDYDSEVGMVSEEVLLDKMEQVLSFLQSVVVDDKALWDQPFQSETIYKPRVTRGQYLFRWLFFWCTNYFGQNLQPDSRKKHPTKVMLKSIPENETMIWNLSNCKLRYTLADHIGYVNVIVVSPDGHFVLAVTNMDFVVGFG
ncbi:hypothetical protein AgCh_017033 [Apium graveolens]